MMVKVEMNFNDEYIVCIVFVYYMYMYVCIEIF